MVIEKLSTRTEIVNKIRVVRKSEVDERARN
jgi:hypothetical protein